MIGNAEAQWAERAALAGLYLAGLDGGGAPRRGWIAVSRAVRAAACDVGGVEGALRRAGLSLEAAVAATPGVLARAEALLATGHCLTAACPAYPARWRASLRGQAPPCLWRRGEVPEGGFVAVVGSRRVGLADARFARGVGFEARRLGFAVASGGAAGCDRLAAQGALSFGGAGVLEILPCGLDRAGPWPEGACVVSLCAPWESFSAQAAMRRNALIYAAGDVAVVVRARLGEGGTWHGALAALRGRLTPLAVQSDAGCPAARALVGLGAAPLSEPSDLAAAVAAARSAPFGQPVLFGEVRERRQGYGVLAA